MQGLRHIIECNCILPQFKNRLKPPFHQFPVFSIIDDDNTVKSKMVQCENCGIIHKVHEIGKSTILKNKENMSSIITIEDLVDSLNDKLVSLLQKNNVEDVSKWEEAKFIIDNEQWGNFIVLSKDLNDDEVNIKLLKIISKNIFVVENETRIERI